MSSMVSFANRGRNPCSHVLYAWFNALWAPSLQEMQIWKSTKSLGQVDSFLDYGTKG